MKMKNWKLRNIRTAGVFLLLSVVLAGCQRQQAPAEERIHIGVTYYNRSDTYLSELLEDFKEDVRKLETDEMHTAVTVTDAGGSQKTQNDQVKELIDAGCNVLCVNLVDRSAPSEIIDLARERGISVIFFNREPVAEDMMQQDGLYYVGADAKESGVMQGELAADWIRENPWIDRNRDGKIQYVVLEGEPGHQDAIIRTENAVETLKNEGIELEKLSYQMANWNRAQAQNRMEQMISQYQNGIELVLANNDAMALGAMDAYRKRNYTETALPVFFGIDGIKEGLQAVRDSRMAGTVYNDKEGQAEAMAQLAVALVTGEGMEDIEFEKDKYIYLPYRKVTQENVSSFYQEDE